MDKIITDTHAAIDRLVAHLERQATEHVHALDALRAENEALRTQNAHLRALQAAQEAKPVREVVRGTYGKHHMKMLSDGVSGRHAIKWHPVNAGWVPYDGDSGELHDGLTEPEAIAWVLDGVLPTR